jgi:predicted Zn finger-like uncharacterized protein
MDVTCPACAARYTVDEQKLHGKSARMRCRACDTVWLVPGSEDNMNESKRAAVVKRGGDRDHRDLFASVPADLGSVGPTLRPPPPDSMLGNGVASRNETSVLFTVDALRGAARINTPAAAEPAPLSSGFVSSSDDEGIIDLNALASIPPKVGSRSVAPLFSEPPPGAFAADVFDSEPAALATVGGLKLGKRAFAGIAAAAVALVLCSIGIAAAFKGEDPVARSAANTFVAPVVTSAPAAADPGAPVVVAPPTVASTSDDDAKTSAASGKKKGRGGKRAISGGGGANASFSKVQSSGVSSPAASKPAPIPKAADKCGCKGDFNCILRCTAKGS